MRAKTGEWLDPMMTAAQFRGDIDISALLRRAATADDASARAIDWIRFSASVSAGTTIRSLPGEPQ